MTKDELKQLNDTVKTRFEIVTQAELLALDEATTKAHAAGKLVQRPQSQMAINKYANDIVNGDWLANPQSITVTKEGWLLDGWHRVKGAIQSGRDVLFNVTRNWPSQDVFRVLDTGKSRSTVAITRMSGMKYAERRLGIANALINIAGEKRRTLSVSEFNRIQHIFARDIDVVLELRSKAPNVGNPAFIMGAFVFLHSRFPDLIHDFAEDYYTMRFTEGSPVRALKRYIERNLGKDMRACGLRCAFNAIHAYVEKKRMDVVTDKQEGIAWALKVQADKAAEVKAIFNAKA